MPNAMTDGQCRYVVVGIMAPRYSRRQIFCPLSGMMVNNRGIKFYRKSGVMINFENNAGVITKCIYTTFEQYFYSHVSFRTILFSKLIIKPHR